MLAPSNANPTGSFPASNLVGAWLAGYHFSSANFSGFAGGAPLLGGCDPGVPALCARPGIKLAIATTTTSNDRLTARFVFMIRYSQGFGPVVQGFPGSRPEARGKDRKS